MTARLIRGTILVVFVGGIAGMIVTSIADSNGGAVTFGLITATAALCLIVATATGGPDGSARAPRFDAETGAELEERIARLAASGADENELRDLVRLSVRLGASRSKER